MRALVLEAAGKRPSLAMRDVATPTPGAHDVLVEVAACGVCHHDLAVATGVLRRGVRPGIILGHEISGRVIDTGDGVTAVSIGQPVTATLTAFCGRCERCLGGREYRCSSGQGFGHAINGGFAEIVKVPESSVVPLAAEAGLKEACLFGCPIGVALHALRDVADVRHGQTVLVIGAGGGLGVHCVQVSAALGARVLAVTTSPDKVGLLEGLAGCEVVLADELDFSEIALALTEDRGVDVVVNTVGSAVFSSALRSLTLSGRMILLGETTSGKTAINLAELIFRDAQVLASSGADRRHIEEAAALAGSGRVKPVISMEFPLEEAGTAFRMMRDRQIFGRAILVP